jgi:hypothetical protein
VNRRCAKALRLTQKEESKNQKGKIKKEADGRSSHPLKGLIHQSVNGQRIS